MKCFVAVLPLLAVAAVADKVDPYAAPAPRYAPKPYSPPAPKYEAGPSYDAPKYDAPKYDAPKPQYKAAPEPQYKPAPAPKYDAPKPKYEPAPAPKYEPAPAPKYDAPKAQYKPAPAKYEPAPAPKYDAPKPQYRPAPAPYAAPKPQYRPQPKYAPAPHKPSYEAPYNKDHEDYAGPPQPYEYQYGVADGYTGTQYKAVESQDAAGAVVGSYSVNLPDGRVQTVTYHTDEYGGFNADVTYEGEAQYPPEPEEGYGNSYKKHEKRPSYAPKPAYAPAPKPSYAPA